MSIKFSISTVTIALLLTISHASIAAAEAYKTSKGQVIVTGLTSQQKYPVQTVNAKNKSKKLKDNYKSLVVGTEAIDPATLSIKTHARCNGKKTTAAKKVSKKKTLTTVTTGTTTTGTTTTGTTVTPTTTTPAVK
jgi:hypothetical protein